MLCGEGGALKPPITVDPLECSPEQAFCRHKKLIHVTPQLTRFVCTTRTVLLYMLKCRKYKGTCSVYCAARIERQSIVYTDQCMLATLLTSYIQRKLHCSSSSRIKSLQDASCAFYFHLPQTKIFLLPACSSRSI